ncbi:MAG TPA: potassium-transporting ATPase subunit F [Acidimicrobiales bacterium]|nr:potassium-transporting ATPase subunit F [Acidimicrobiales bacterium]
MNAVQAVLLLVAIVLFVYLGVAMFLPERF